MNKYVKIIFIAILFQFINLDIHAQALTGNKTINSQGTGVNNYVSLKSAIDSINKYRVGIGGVTFNISANHVEIAPKGGYILSSWVNLAGQQITFQKSGIGENPQFIAYKGDKSFSSNQPDGIFNIVGTDFVHLSELSFIENSNNISNTELMEYGIGIFLADTGDKSHHITIDKCKIKLSRNNISNINSNIFNGSTGIIILSRIHNNIKTYENKKIADADIQLSNNEISNVNTGIEANGYLNKIAISNNKINDFGNNIFSTISSYGISIKNCKNYRINNNEISSTYIISNTFSANKKSSGIQLFNEIKLNAKNIVDNNYIKMISSNNVNHLVGIVATNLDTITIVKNTIDTISINTNDTSSIIAIDIKESSSVKIDSNVIQNQIYYTPVNGIADIYNIRINKCSNVHVLNNNIKFTKTKNKLYNRKLYANLYVLTCDNVIIESNDIQVLKTSTQDIYRYYTIHTLNNKYVKISKNKIYSLDSDKYYSINSSLIYSKDFSSNISNNILENIYSYRDLSLINCEQLINKNTAVINNNIVRNVTTNNGFLHAIRTYKHKAKIYNNKIYNINLIDYGTLQVIRIDSNEKVKCFNNAISNINASYISTIGANPFIIAGIYVRSSNIKNSLIEIYNNSIRLQVSNASTNLLTACIYHDNYNKFYSEGELLLLNNIFNNYSSVSSVNQNSSSNIIVTGSTTKFYSIHKQSNNNIYYLGTTKLRRYFYRDFDASYLNFYSYKAFGYPRETKTSNNSVDFINHLNAELGINDSTINYAESNGKHILDNTFDITGKKRPGYTYSKNNSGYGTDIGAFEFDGIDTSKIDNKSPIIELDTSTSNIDVCNDSTHKFKLYAFDQSKIISVKLYWREDIDSLFTVKPFNVINDSSFEVTLNLSSNNIDYYFEVIDSLDNKTTSEIYQFNRLKLIYKFVDNEAFTRLGDTLRYTIHTNSKSTVGNSKDAFIGTNFVYGKYSDSGTSQSFLYTAEELRASGLRKGYINSMMFKNLNHATGFNLIIDWMSIAVTNTKRKTIDVDSIFNIQTVYETTNYWPTMGENKHIFDTPFYWDGVSNIIIKICTESKEYSSHNWQSEYIYANDSTSILNNGVINTGNSCEYYYSPSYYNAKPLIYLQSNSIPEFVYWYSNDSNANIIEANKPELLAKPLSTGNYKYIRVSSYNNCINLDTLRVHVNLFEQLNLEDTLYVCENDLKEIDAKNEGSNYWWYVNNQFISNNQKIYANTTGNYIVVVRDNLNNVYIDSTYLIAYDVENVNLGADTQMCQRNLFVLTSNVTAEKYLWSNGDTTKSTHEEYTNDVKLRATFKNGCSSEDEINIDYDGIVYLDPYYFYYPDTVYKHFMASNYFLENTFYIWNMDDPLSTENIKMGHHVSHKFITKKDMFNISVRAYKPGYNCEYFDTIAFKLVSVDDVKSLYNINVYPNPINKNSILSYNLTQRENNISLVIFDLMGRKVKEYLNNENQLTGNYQINLSELLEYEKGMYILKLQINDSIYIDKLINE